MFDDAHAVAVDALGFVYVAGETDSVDFSTTAGASDTTHNGSNDAFVRKYAPDGSLVFSTLLGGPNDELAFAIEVGQDGAIYIAGRASDGLPTTPGAFQPAFGGDVDPGGAGPKDGFVAKLANDGAIVEWATYFGWNGPEVVTDLAVDATGIYVALANARDVAPCPHVTAGAFQPVFGGGVSDIVVAKLALDGSTLLYASYLGGSGFEAGNPSIAVDSMGAAYVLTATSSADAPVTPGAFQTTRKGGSDVLLAKVAPDGGSLQYATYFGGGSAEGDFWQGLSIDGAGVAYITSTTLSSDLPVSAGAFQPIYRGTGASGSEDLFVAAISADGAAVLACTYLGGALAELVGDTVVDTAGNVYVTGRTDSSDFPTASAPQPAIGGMEDGFFVELSPDLTTLTHGTFVGGSDYDVLRAIAVRPDGLAAYAVGVTASSDFPVTANAEQAAFGGFLDSVVVASTF